MSTKDGVNPLELKYNGVFDFDDMYKYVYKWLLDRLYIVQEGKFKHKPDSVPDGWEYETVISGDKKIDAYYRYYVKITLHGRDCIEIKKGKKTLLNGRIYILIEADIERDYSKRFDKNKFTKMLEKLYNFITKREFEILHWDSYYYELQRFQQDIKKHLKMYTDKNYIK